MSIAITGLGIVSAIGLDTSEVLASLLQKRSGVNAVWRIGDDQLPVGKVALGNEDMKARLGIAPERTVSRTALMGMMAVKEAMGGMEPQNGHGGCKTVLVSGTTVGGMDITEQAWDASGTVQRSEEFVSTHDCGVTTEAIASYFGCFSSCTTISTACSSAANAIIFGARLLEAGEADRVVCGGCEALSDFHISGFNSLMILDKELCRPFDANRAGLNLGEGAAYLVMERQEDAARRGAPIFAVLAGYGNACDAFHQTASSANGEGAYLAMTQALGMAGIKPEMVDYVNAHGTGTPNNDASESAALFRVFSNGKNNMPLVSSTKAFTGHTTSASGSIEAVICLLAMEHGFVPENLGWKTQMEDGITPAMGICERTLDWVMCNSFGFGGNDSSLLFCSDKQERNGAKAHTECSRIAEDEIEQVEVVIDREEQLKEISHWVKPLEARRMGRLMKSSLLSSMKALEQAGIDTPDAIITATRWGCWENSEKLLNATHQYGEETEGAGVSPTLFMQSTHNTIGSNIAIRTHCHGYNITYSHGKDSLRWALRDARMLLENGKASSVLVGLHDEMTPRLGELLGTPQNGYSFCSQAMVLKVTKKGKK